MLDPVSEPFHVITKDSNFHEIFKLKKIEMGKSKFSKKDFFQEREKRAAL